MNGLVDRMTGLASGSSAGLIIILARISTILLAAWILHALLRNNNPRWRILLWRVTSLGIICVAVLSLRAPSFSLPLIPSASTQLAATGPQPVVAAGRVAALKLSAQVDETRSHFVRADESTLLPSRHVSTTIDTEAAAAKVAQSQSFSSDGGASDEPDQALSVGRPSFLIRWTLSQWVLLTWCGGLLWGLTRTLVGVIQVTRMTKAAEPVPSWVASEITRLSTLAPQIDSVQVIQTSAMTTPVSFGLIRNTILLPSAMCAKSRADEVRAALAHELAHFRGHDLLWNHLLHLQSILLWFHPLVWPIRLAHADACDERCDVSAARFFEDPKAYGRALARMALHASGRATFAALTMVRRSSVARRIDLLQRKIGAHGLSRWKTGIASVSATAVILLVSTVGISRSADEPTAPPAINDTTDRSSITQNPHEQEPEKSARKSKDVVGSNEGKPKLSENKLLSGSTTIRGRIVDTAEQPVTDNMVQVLRRQGSKPTGGSLGGLVEIELDRSRTDVRGRFVFDRLPDDCSFFILKCQGRDGKTVRSVVVADPRKRQVTALIKLQPPDPEKVPMKIQGVVRDSQGQPIARVKVRDPDRQHEEHFTDNEGRFELLSLPYKGKIRLDTNKTGYSPRNYTFPADLAKDGPLVLILKTYEEMKARGRIRFLSGRSTNKLSAEFKLKDNEGEYGGARSFSSSDCGRFEVTLQRDTVLAGKARFSTRRMSDHEIQPRWWTHIKGLAPGIGDAEIVINDTGSIEVEVDTIDASREIEPIKIQLEMRHTPLRGSYAPVAGDVLGHKGGTVLFEHLCPGDYRVKIEVPLFHYRSWYKKTTLAENEERLHQRVTFPLPKMGYGSVRGRLIGDDCATPKTLDVAKINSSGALRVNRGVRYDPSGNFFARRVVSGRFWLTIKANGYVKWSRDGIVEPGKTTDLGLITLKRKTSPGPEDGFGIAMGRLLYGDGTPVLGTYSTGILRKTVTDKDGTFAEKIPAGQRYVEFNLTNTRIWPGAYAAHVEFYGTAIPHRVKGSHWVGSWWDYRLVANFAMTPNQTNRRDVVIPLKNLTPLRFHWLGEKEGHLRIGCFSTADKRQFQRYGSFISKAPCVIEIPDVRPGDRIVTFRTDDSFGYKRFAPDEAELSAIFRPARFGSIKGQVVRSNGSPNAKVTVYACPAELEVTGAIRSTTGDSLPFVYDMKRKWSALASLPTNSDGRFEFPNVAPGKYVLYVDKDTEANVVVKTGQRTEAKIKSDRISSGFGPPDLREAHE